MANLDDPHVPPGTDPSNHTDVHITPPARSTSPDGSSVFPDPIASPNEFMAYLVSLANPDLVKTWEHLQKRPLRVPGTNRLVDGVVTTWSDKMDSMVVSPFLFRFYNTLLT